MSNKGYEIKGTLSVDGKYLVLDHPNIIKRALKGLMEQELIINVDIFRYKRSDAQNRYIWGVVVPCVRVWFKETTGDKLTADEAYTWLRVGLLGYKAEVRELMGIEVITMTGKRFSQMNTKEFAEAIDEILQKMAAKGCVIPEPRQNNFFTDFSDD